MASLPAHKRLLNCVKYREREMIHLIYCVVVLWYPHCFMNSFMRRIRLAYILCLHDCETCMNNFQFLSISPNFVISGDLFLTRCIPSYLDILNTHHDFIVSDFIVAFRKSITLFILPFYLTVYCTLKSPIKFTTNWFVPSICWCAILN